MNVIKEYKELSEYISETSTKTATVIRELGTGRYIVRMRGDAGSYYTASVASQDEAENVADDWIRS